MRAATGAVRNERRLNVAGGCKKHVHREGKY